MALLLNIDTATSYGAVAISYNGEVISAVENYSQKEHALFLHRAVGEVLVNSGKQMADLDAIVVVTGPGSYTGLRVGLSAAKGLCYATGKPLVGVNTLQAIALAASVEQFKTEKPVLFVPMIDARRMEVFTAAYDIHNRLHTPPAAVVVDDSFLRALQEDYFLVFAGDGSEKLKQLIPGVNFIFSNRVHSIEQIANIGGNRFNEGLFEDVAYSEPFYLKPFFSTAFVKK